jgi:hypothetical protein
MRAPDSQDQAQGQLCPPRTEAVPATSDSREAVRARRGRCIVTRSAADPCQKARASKRRRFCIHGLRAVGSTSPHGFCSATAISPQNRSQKSAQAAVRRRRYRTEPGHRHSHPAAGGCLGITGLPRPKSPVEKSHTRLRRVLEALPPAAPWAQDLRTRRKPRPSLRLPGSNAKRRAERQYPAELSHEPPRSARAAPMGPSGSSTSASV